MCVVSVAVAAQLLQLLIDIYAFALPLLPISPCNYPITQTGSWRKASAVIEQGMEAVEGLTKQILIGVSWIRLD